MLEDRMGKRLPLSWFQRVAAEVLARHGIVMEDEWPVHDDAGQHVASLDLANVALKVGLECQSIEYHATAADVAQDIHRKRTLRRMGWDVTELWWSDLDRIDAVVDDLMLAFERARRLGL
ncbi:MAG: REase, partial [Ilumatobacteraceae bacterium]|nr:REase [Ilumatobacteraceae bacterium]